jgi:hypothetical protein
LTIDGYGFTGVAPYCINYGLNYDYDDLDQDLIPESMRAKCETLPNYFPDLEKIAAERIVD